VKASTSAERRNVKASTSVERRTHYESIYNRWAAYSIFTRLQLL